MPWDEVSESVVGSVAKLCLCLIWLMPTVEQYDHFIDHLIDEDDSFDSLQLQTGIWNVIGCTVTQNLIFFHILFMLFMLLCVQKQITVYLEPDELFWESVFNRHKTWNILIRISLIWSIKNWDMDWARQIDLSAL